MGDAALRPSRAQSIRSHAGQAATRRQGAKLITCNNLSRPAEHKPMAPSRTQRGTATVLFVELQGIPSRWRWNQPASEPVIRVRRRHRGGSRTGPVPSILVAELVAAVTTVVGGERQLNLHRTRHVLVFPFDNCTSRLHNARATPFLPRASMSSPICTRVP